MFNVQRDSKKRGKLFVIYGPSGVGKTTLVKVFLNKGKKRDLFVRVPSYTTRPPRLGECDGVDYHFISDEDFQNKINESFFLEWSREYGAYYGCSRSDINSLLEFGRSIFLVIDRQGVEQIASSGFPAIFIMIVPPNNAVLLDRLKKRGTESEERIQFRLQQSLKELEKEQKNPCFDYKVINSSIDRSIRAIDDIVERELGWK